MLPIISEQEQRDAQNVIKRIQETAKELGQGVVLYVGSNFKCEIEIATFDGVLYFAVSDSYTFIDPDANLSTIINREIGSAGFLNKRFTRDENRLRPRNSLLIQIPEADIEDSLDVGVTPIRSQRLDFYENALPQANTQVYRVIQTEPIVLENQVFYEHTVEEILSQEAKP